jgi:hypothetical protein
MRVVGANVYTADGALFGEFSSHSDACRAMFDNERHVVTYFDWRDCKIRILGPVFETRQQAETFATGSLADSYDDLRVIPESQVPDDERQGMR